MITTIKTLSRCLAIFALVVAVSCRYLPHTASFDLVSDGSVGQVTDQNNKTSSLLLLPSSREVDEEELDTQCEQMYGFLPCSRSIYGHLFLIVVYEYLLFHGESYVAEGSERIFKILGPGVFGASAFHILGALPESLLLLASGMLNTKEKAEEYVLNAGVGLVAGSSILLLTIVWGTCVIVGRQALKTSSSSVTIIVSSNDNNTNTNLFSTLLLLPFQRLRALLTGYGITTDSETSYLARIMVLSVIPFVIMEISNIFKGYWERIIMLVALFVSLSSLLFYFVYQVFQPWIQQRRLEYVKHAYLISTILQHVQKRALGRLLTDNGAPNLHAIRRLFDEIDEDRDNFVSASEVKELFFEIKFKAHIEADKERAIAEVMNKFDLDGDRRITKDEFENGLIKWLNEVKLAVDQQIFSPRSLKDISQAFRPWVQNRRREREIRRNLVLEILKNCEANGFQSLRTEDGRPSLKNIRSLFERFDVDGDNFISQSELKELILNIKFGTIPVNVNEAVNKLMQELDTSGDNLISEEEFVLGLVNLLNTNQGQSSNNSNAQTEDDIYQKSWEETDKLVKEENSKGIKSYKDESSKTAWTKAIMYLVIGVIILSLLAEPLIESVQSFSHSAGIPSFFISFILVPLATNARVATAAISTASRQTPRTTSLTFSELYGGVFMNNIVGFSVLLSLIYFREMTWELSAEILAVLIICLAVGIIASFRSKFALWSAFFAYMLYPLSLLLVYSFNHVLHYT